MVYRGEFDPHGQVVLESATGGATYLNSHKFTGYEREWATNLDYAKARTYSHNRGRFLQPDPLGLAASDLSNPQSLNRYSYVGNDPVNRVDPSGLRWVPKYEETCVGLVGGERSCESTFLGVDWADDDWNSPKGSGGASGGTPWEWSIPPNPTPNKEAQPSCTFNIDITNSAGLTQRQLQRTQNEIQRIFQGAGQNVVFNNAGAANGGSYNLTIQRSGHPALISKGIVAPGWTPANLSAGAVSNSGYASTQVLAGAIQAGLSSHPAQQALGRHPDNLAIGLGRVGAHEAGHYFLQLINHSSQGVMRVGFAGSQWFSPAYNSTFQFTKAQAQQLSQLCP